MRKLAPVLLLAGLAACYEKSNAAAETAPAPAGATWDMTYLSTGHPIVARTEDGGTLTREAEVEALVNSYRVSIGLNALQSVADLRDVARAHSEHMIAHEFFGHRSPEEDLPADRVRLAGLGEARVGENIAAGYSTAQSAFDAWLASEGHRANIEDPSWTHHGVGYAFSASDRGAYYDYWTHNFVRR
jgi:uncharacterized protein YkwD